MMHIIGIDLGTTNSVVAAYRKGEARTISIHGRRKTPSVVSWDPKTGKMSVGHDAKIRVLIHPETSIVSNKRFMGDREKRYEILGKQYTPIDIAAIMLRYLAEGAAEELGGPVAKAVVTVPAYFSNNQKEDTRQAAEQAGLEVLQLQAEPTAAAIAYGFDKGKNQTILVYDLGGGTFDVSLLEVRGNRFEVKALGGDPFLGGDNFDEVLMDHVSKELLSQRGVDVREDPSPAARLLWQQLKELCETCKIELSESKRAEITIPDVMGKGSFETTVTRNRLAEIIAPYLERTARMTLDTIAAAGLAPDDISRVICVGGSTKVPMVHEALTNMVRTPYNAPNVDEIVAEGAAITAAGFYTPDEGRGDLFPVDLRATNVTPHDLGVRVKDDRFSVLIPRNSSLPVTEEKVFTTAHDYADETDVVVFQGENSTCSNNIQLGGFAFKGFPKARAGEVRIRVTFQLDESDILEVTAVDEASRVSNSITIEKFEPKPYQPEPERPRRLSDLRIGVSRVGYDDVGAILTRLGITWREVSDSHFAKYTKLKEFDILFINCLAGGSADRNKKPLERFVSEGGLLYASDCARKHLDSAFPNLFDIRSNSIFSGPVPSQITDEEFATVLGKTSMTINFNTVCFYCEQVNHAEGRIYLTGNGDGENKPILVGAPYGQGHIIFTSFHNYGSATKEELELLKFLVLKPISIATKAPLAELKLPG